MKGYFSKHHVGISESLVYELSIVFMKNSPCLLVKSQTSRPVAS